WPIGGRVARLRNIVRRAKTVTVLALVAAVSAIVAVGPSSAAGPTASPGLASVGKATGGSGQAVASVLNEGLVRYCSIVPRFPVGPGDCGPPPRRLGLTRRTQGACKTKPAACLIYRAMCTADCHVTVRTTL